MRIPNKKQCSILCALAFVLVAGAGCNFNFSVGVPKEPTGDEVQKLVIATMADFTASLEKDDFEILRKNVSINLRQQASANQFRKAFSFYIENKGAAIPLFRETQSVQPTITTQKIRKETGTYVLETVGSFAASETEINFQLNYLREDGKWKLLKIDIKT